MFGFSVEWRHLQYPNEVALLWIRFLLHSKALMTRVWNERRHIHLQISCGLKNIGKVMNETFHDGKKSTETGYFLLSFDEVERFAQTVRGHWGIENRLHWVLDVSFGEDDCRVRKDHAPENFSTI